MLQTPSLMEESFAVLQKNATSFSDIADWFKENPAALLGDISYPDNATITVEYTIPEYWVVETANKKGTVKLSLVVELSYPVVNSLIASTTNSHGSIRSCTKLREEVYFEMGIREWPVACAFVAACFLNERVNERTDKDFTGLRGRLNTYLPEHFQEWTLERLLDLYAAGLLPLDMFGDVDVMSVQKLLLASPSSADGQALPLDIMLLR